MKKLLLIAFLFFYSGSAWAACNTTPEEDTTTLYECEDGNTLTINSGITVSRNSSSAPRELVTNVVDSTNHNNVTIINNGTMTNVKQGTIYLKDTGGHTITNTGTITGDSYAVWITGSNGATITNSGTITGQKYGGITSTGWLTAGAGDITIDNSGTILGGKEDHNANNRWLMGGISINCGAGDADETCGGGTVTITNSGTIQGHQGKGSDGPQQPALMLDNQSTNIIYNSGTLIGYQNSTEGRWTESNWASSDAETQSNASDIIIENMGEDAQVDDMGHKRDARSGGNVGKTTTIHIQKGAAFTRGIDFNQTTGVLVFETSINRDVPLTIYDKDNVTFTTNGHEYTCTDADLDDWGDGDWYSGVRSGQDCNLTILGEALEVAQNNQKYRGENTLTKLRGLFNAANYVGGTWPDYCTTADPEDVDSELDEVCNQRFVKLFHSYQRRDKVYDGTTSGVVGMLSPIKWKGFPLVSNIFAGYANQKGDFDNGEYLGGDNYVLGFKNTYENKGFKASLTPMIGVNDLGVIDYDTDKIQKIANSFLSEFAAVNGKIKKKIVTGENRSLNVSIETTYGLQRFPDYLSKFTDGDLSVDESIEQLLSGGFEVSYLESLPGNFVIKPYFGANLNQNLTGQTKIIADGENKNVSPLKENWSGYYAGVSLTKEVKGTDFDLNLMYGNEDGLINQIASFSLTKSFGKAKVKTAVLEKTPDFPKVDESLTTQDYNKDLNELESLKDLNKKLKADNAALKDQNEKLKLLAQKTLQQNKAKEKLIVELLKENEKIKLSKEIFKNKLLEHENEELLRSIEGDAKKSESNKLVLLYFLALYITTVLLLTSLIASLYNKIRYREARSI